MIAAVLALAVAAATIGGVAGHPRWWRAAVSLAVLGGIAPMIMAVNIRLVPVFGRRDWPGLTWLRVQVVATIAGAWLVYAGRIRGEHDVIVAGSALALAGGLLFAVNTGRLFRQPAKRPAPPLPFAEQAAVDRMAIRFTRLSGLYLLTGLIVGLLIELWTPHTGRWDLVWAHALLVGFFLTMASGICYHVMSRWTAKPWRWTAPIRWHLWLVTAGLPLMLLALATNQKTLFMIAGPLQSAALAIFLITIAPMVIALPEPTRFGVCAAAFCLLLGIGLGASFAIDPVLGARLRMTHAELNLFGWTGLLISGVGYYLVPRFIGRALRWPRLAQIQIGLLLAATLFGALELGLRAYDKPIPVPIAWVQAALALGFLLYALMIAGTLRGPAGARVTISKSSARQRMQPSRATGPERG
jgi:hypothetical protein